MEKIKLIIVENDPAVSMELKAGLTDLGYEVIASFGNAEEAIEKALHQRPDIILMDIKLDGLMDGIQAADIISERYGIPVVFLTAYVDEYKLEQLKIVHPFGILQKPVQERDLKFTIEMALHFSKTEAERRQVAAALEQKVNDLSKQNEDLNSQLQKLKQQIEEQKTDISSSKR